MKISAKGQYAVRLMLEIAKATEPISISTIAKNQGISSKYLEQIASALIKSDLINSVRGKDGGYVLTKQPNQISIKEILDTTGDACNLAPCISGECTRKHNCNASTVWLSLGSLINNYLQSVTLQTLITTTN